MSVDQRELIDLPCEILEEQLFREWLDSKEDEDQVGIAGEASACPIAQYATEVLRKREGFDGKGYPWRPVVGGYFYLTAFFPVSVGPGSIGFSSQVVSNECEMPTWATEFIRLIDYGVYRDWNKVKASRAKAALDEVDRIIEGMVGG